MDFSEIAHKGLHKRILEIFKGLSISREMKILDIGCGNGNFIHELSILGYNNLHGCDGYLENDKILEFAMFKKQSLSNQLEYKDEIFDIVVLTEVIEHLENPNMLLKEIHRVLIPGGILVLSTPNIFTFVSRFLFFIEGTFFQFRHEDTKFNQFPGHIAPFFPYIFSEIFQKDFKIQNISYSNFIVPILQWEFPFRNKYFGNTVILVIEKI